MSKSFNDLHSFCEHIVRKYNHPGAVSEEQLAEEFRTVYFKGWPLDLWTLMAFATSCGIRIKGIETMPQNVRGYHEVYDDHHNIYFRKGDVPSGIENTILHEIREMIETLYTKVQKGYTSLQTSAQHIAANKFASAVLLPEEDFRQQVYQTGFDVIALSSLYSKSCAQVLLRMGEVLQGRLFMYAALYEPDASDITKWKANYITISHNKENPEANFHRVKGFFPRKGRIVEIGSLVDMAIRNGKAHMVQQITVLDDMTDEGLTAIARPLIDPATGTIKVAHVILLARDAHLLSPQVERAKPFKVEYFHRHI